MPELKRQHYVPRCYLKAFSKNEDGAAINLINISRSKAIMNAPTKGQCAKNYFYGEDLKTEKALQRFEGMYGHIIKKAIADEYSLDADELNFLREFSFLQSRRTEMAVQRLRIMSLNLANAVFQGSPVPKEYNISDRELMRQSLEFWAMSNSPVDDLKIRILKNNTEYEFVTSDDPAIFTNKYFFQKICKPSFGIRASGVLFFLPLSPFICAVCYDGKTYTIPDKAGDVTTIDDVKDIFAINKLQYLHAVENIYFRDWDSRAQILDEISATSRTSPEARCEINFAIFDKSVGNHDRYKVVSEGEARNAENVLLHFSQKYPDPGTWCSKLKYRNPIRQFYNGTGTGRVRKREWLK